MKNITANHALFYALAIGLFFCWMLTYDVARADSIIVGGWSTHIASPDSQYNQDHRLIGYDSEEWLFASFKNSYDRDSFAIMKGWHKRTSLFRLSLYGGGVYGYRSCYGDEGEDGRLCPLIVPAVSYTRYKLQPAVFLMGEALVASVRYEF